VSPFDLRQINMLTSSVARNQFEEWMDDYQAKLREGVQ
jgi:hypothetical protein